MLRVVLLLALVCAAPLHADPAATSVDGFLAYLSAEMQRDPAAAEETVAGLEGAPTMPGAARDRLLDGLVGLFAARGRSELVQRVRALKPAAASTLAPEPLAFPGDHAHHHGSFLEWWYFSGNHTSGARRYGFELSFFRTAVAVHYVHAAITDAGGGAHPWQRRWVRPWQASFAPGGLGVSMAGC
ncbi:MAG: hypothetical protein JO329_07655, partial [Planctomycetaceae bacterium]|nr:hypothetical protein [Planctomycetaceae bacterium]